MPGEAKTTQFMLGTATLMFGAPEEVFDLRPDTHGVGLTKGVSVTTEPQFTDLTQGVTNSNVYSVLTSNAVRASAEVYEYTAKNLAYSLNLDGGNVTPPTAASTLAAAVVASDTTIDLDSEVDFSVGDNIVIQGDSQDEVYVREITAIDGTTGAVTVDRALPNAIAAGNAVRGSSVLKVGSKETQPFLGCKIVGVTAEKKPITLIFPKVRVTSGANIAFTTDDYGNMPFEMTMYDLVPTDPNYADFRTSTGILVV